MASNTLFNRDLSGYKKSVVTFNSDNKIPEECQVSTLDLLWQLQSCVEVFPSVSQDSFSFQHPQTDHLRQGLHCTFQVHAGRFVNELELAHTMYLLNQIDLSTNNVGLNNNTLRKRQNDEFSEHSENKLESVKERSEHSRFIKVSRIFTQHMILFNFCKALSSYMSI